MGSFSQTLNSNTKFVFISLFAKGRSISISRQMTLLYFLKRRGKWVTRFSGRH